MDSQDECVDDYLKQTQSSSSQQVNVEEFNELQTRLAQSESRLTNSESRLSSSEENKTYRFTIPNFYWCSNVISSTISSHDCTKYLPNGRPTKSSPAQWRPVRRSTSRFRKSLYGLLVLGIFRHLIIVTCYISYMNEDYYVWIQQIIMYEDYYCSINIWMYESIVRL